MNINTIIKSDGTEVPFDPSKLNRMAEWGDTVGVCWSELVFDALKKVNDKCTTKDLQQALIDACAEKQTKEHMDMAGRLYLGSLYKTVHGGFETRPSLVDFYYDMQAKGVWERLDYDDTELEYLNDVLDNSKDLDYKLSTIKQISSKYSKKFCGEVCETPQYTFMGIAMKAMESQPEERRLEDVTKLYTYLSDLKINMPTPFLAGLRTSFKGFASCCVIKSDDTADSIENLVHAAYKFTNASSGIGGTLTTRSVKDPIRDQPSKHTGKIPYYRYLQGAVKSTKQEVRGGGATVHFTVLDPEIETLLRLKHPTTVEDRRIRGLDYSLGATKLLAEKASLKKQWMLVSYYDSPDLYEAHFKGYNEFKKVYEAYEESDKPRKYVSAFEVVKLFLVQRSDTGRMYHTWLDEMNTHTSFKDPIYSSNLCVAPDTLILTDKGDIPIKLLEGEYVNIWNGDSWSIAPVVKTGSDQTLVTATVRRYKDGTFIEDSKVTCTPYHKWYLENGEEVRTFQLNEGDWLEVWETPEGSLITSCIVELNAAPNQDTYCVNEPIRHKAVFNGVLTGQCQEIFLPTKGFENITDMYDATKGVDAGEIALCFLSCLVAGRISEEEYEDVAYYSLLAVDNVIDLMEYPFPQVENTAKGRRSVGIGITNLAHDLASKGLSYSSMDGKNYMHRLAEMHSYYLHKASLRLAKEKGNCKLIGRTKYPDGWLPIDTYNKNVDSIHKQALRFDWEGLRKDIISNGGIRNSVLEATPPAESSSQASETTNGLYPIREYYTTKRSGSIVNIFAAPDIDIPEVRKYYELAYDVPSKDLVDCYAIFQKFHGQGISGDLYTDYSKYPNEKVPLSVMMDLYFYCVKMGLKSLYYQNSKGGIKEGSSIVDDMSKVISTVLEDEDDCESCKM